MKKSLLIVAVLGFALTSCKKDRVCSCKTVTSYTGTWTGPAGLKPADSVTDDKYTMVDVSLVTARRACVHTKTEGAEYLGVKANYDTNCSLE